MASMCTKVFRGYRLNDGDLMFIPHDIYEDLRDEDVLVHMGIDCGDTILGEEVMNCTNGGLTRLSPIKDFNFGDMDSRIKADYYRAFGEMPKKEPHFYVGVQVW